MLLACPWWCLLLICCSPTAHSGSSTGTTDTCLRPVPAKAHAAHAPVRGHSCYTLSVPTAGGHVRQGGLLPAGRPTHPVDTYPIPWTHTMVPGICCSRELGLVRATLGLSELRHIKITCEGPEP